MNDTRWALRPAMKATLREGRSSLQPRMDTSRLGLRQRGGKLRPTVECLGALAGFSLDEFRDESDLLSSCCALATRALVERSRNGELEQILTTLQHYMHGRASRV